MRNGDWQPILVMIEVLPDDYMPHTFSAEVYKRRGYLIFRSGTMMVGSCGEANRWW